MGQEETRRSLTSRVARGTAWIAGARLVMRALGLLNTIVVARLLAPEDFGLVAVAMSAMLLLQGFSDIGVAQAVVRFDDADRDDLDTLFTLSAVRGLLIGLLLAGSAPLAGAFYGDARLTGVFLAIAVTPVAMGCINPRFYEYERRLDFSKEFVFSVVNKLIGVIASITVAIIYRSYWAIIAGVVAGALTQLAISYLMRPHPPRLTLASMRKVFGFSGWLTGVSFMAALNNKLDAFILARVIGVKLTGTYYLGMQLSELSAAELASPLARAIYPGLSELKREPERMRAAFLRGVAALGAVAMPASLGFAFVAPDFISVFLGEKWRASIPVIQILAPVLGLQTLFFAIQSYAMALGMTRLVFFRELIFFCVRLPVFVWAAVVHGLAGAVWAAAGLGLVHIAFNAALYARAAGASPLDPFWSARRSLMGLAAMAAYFAWARPLLPGLDEMAAGLRLMFDIAAGASVYAGVHALAWAAAGRPDGVERVVVDALKKLRPNVSKA